MKAILAFLMLCLSLVAWADEPKPGTYTIMTRDDEPYLRIVLTKSKEGVYTVTGGELRTNKLKLSGTLSKKKSGWVLRAKLRRPGSDNEGYEVDGGWDPEDEQLLVTLFKSERFTVAVPKAGSNTGKKTTEGYFKLVDSKQGTYQTTMPGGYGTWTASMTKTTINESWQPNGDRKDLKPMTLTGTWDTPPSQLTPGQVFNLNVSATAQVNKDYSVGMDCKWSAEGSIETLQSKKAYAGTDSANGQIIPSAQGQYTFRVGKGGKIVLYAYGGGMVAKSPCTYTYEWVAGK